MPVGKHMLASNTCSTALRGKDKEIGGKKEKSKKQKEEKKKGGEREEEKNEFDCHRRVIKELP